MMKNPCDTLMSTILVKISIKKTDMRTASQTFHLLIRKAASSHLVFYLIPAVVGTKVTFNREQLWKIWPCRHRENMGTLLFACEEASCSRVDHERSMWGRLETTASTWKKLFVGQRLKYKHHVWLSLQLHAMMTVLTQSDEVEQLVLRNTDLTDELLFSLVGALKRSQSEVTLLNLNLNLIGPYGAHILLGLLRVKTQIQGLQ